MKHIRYLGPAPDFNVDMLSIDIPTLPHVYGTTKSTLEDSPYWLEYQQSNGAQSNLQIAYGIYLAYPEITTEVCRYLGTIFDYPFRPHRVLFLKTTGNVGYHIDLDIRSAVNIGVLNSNSAITEFDDGDKSMPFIPTEEVQCQDGHAYLLNVGARHAVRSIDSRSPRCFIRYGFSSSFASVQELLIKK